MIEMKAAARGIFGTGLKPGAVWHGDRFTKDAIKSAVAHSSEQSIPVRVGGHEVGRATLGLAPEDHEILASITFTHDSPGVLALFKEMTEVGWRGQITRQSADAEGQRIIEGMYLDEIMPEIAKSSIQET